MSAAELPLLPIRRVLVPGTRAALPSERDDLRAGDPLVAVLDPTSGGKGCGRSVGTLAQVEDVRPLGREAVLLRLVGQSLVRLTETRERAGRWWVKAVELPEPDVKGGAVVEAAERALRRYLAVRAEAGEAVDLTATLSRDPVTASHEVASYLRVSWPEVQDILEAGSAAERLRRAQAALERETELLRRLLGREGA